MELTEMYLDLRILLLIAALATGPGECRIWFKSGGIPVAFNAIAVFG